MEINKILTVFFIIVLIGLPSTGSKADSGNKGLEIAKEADRRDLGWAASTVDLKMLLRNAGGETSERTIRISSLERLGQGLGDISLTIFDTPADVRGTAFLSHTKVFEPDDQWLYLPALKRVKRISSKNKSGPFMGSEFAYEDLLSFEVEKYNYSFLKDVNCPTLMTKCFLMERIPVYENSGYTRQIVWIDKDHYRVNKVEYYDRRNAILKTLILSDFQQYKKKYWRASTLEMTNQQTKKSTLLTFSNYNFDAELNINNFKPNKLKRIR